MDKKEAVKKILQIFYNDYGEAECTLKYKEPLELLISTQLAAQCTDQRVNIVTDKLYRKYKNVHDFANADLKELEKDIKSTGFFRNKAKNIKETCNILIEQHNGQVPDTMEKLLKLPGVGRKTANLILGDVFGIPGVVVDTHAKRLSNRIGLSQSDNPKKVEFDLMEVVPKKSWSKFCHQLVYHGRSVCKARKPDCENCNILKYCCYGQSRK
ncbi:endonuclease III [Herbivorax sp. ANBcel31]|uniref:endonuclease III n=1 Tax=Herbivorax sp. ANBcel31 TaxID=3069754 RepID=UPI0027AE223E|nr:endonuclease III [Herbivorax sp. ANBcel31]MDQ2085024.1 endonuclease III [Herbivorax sp. ANBcel31]